MVYEVTRNADGTHTVRRFGAVVRGAVVACTRVDLSKPATCTVQVRLPGMARPISMPVRPGPDASDLVLD